MYNVIFIVGIAKYIKYKINNIKCKMLNVNYVKLTIFTGQGHSAQRIKEKVKREISLSTYLLNTSLQFRSPTCNFPVFFSTYLKSNIIIKAANNI